jgi:hypothetical protein
MTIGSSLFLIGAGAILRYAVTRRTIEGINLDTAGLILMILGALGLVLGLYLLTRVRPATEVPPPPESL